MQYEFTQSQNIDFLMVFHSFLHSVELHKELVKILLIFDDLMYLFAKTRPECFINDKVYRDSANGFGDVRKSLFYQWVLADSVPS